MAHGEWLGFLVLLLISAAPLFIGAILVVMHFLQVLFGVGGGTPFTAERFYSHTKEDRGETGDDA